MARTAALLVGLSGWWLAGAPAHAAGVIVEPIGETPGGALRSGDRLLAFRGQRRAVAGGHTSGSLNHPFDVLSLLPEVAGLEHLVVTVERGGQVLDVEWDDEVLPVAARLERTASASDATALDRAWSHQERARELQLDGETAAADLEWERALTAAATEPQVVGTILLRRAAAVDDAGDVAAAERSYAAAVSALRDHPPGSLTLAQALQGQGTAALRQGRARDALAPLEEATRLRRHAAPGTQTLGFSLNNLGVAYGDVGRLREGQAALQERLVIIRTIDPGSLREASVLNNLGTLAYESGDLVAAESLHRQAKEIRERLAPDSLKMAQSLNNLAAVMEDRGELEKAELWYRQALALRRRLDPRSVDVVSTLGNLAVLLQHAGRQEDAVAFAREGTALAAQVDPDGEREAWALTVLSRVLMDVEPQSAENLEAALRAARRAVAIGDRLIPRSMANAEALAALGTVQMERGALDAAEEALRRALEIRAAQGPGSRWEAASWHELAELEQRRGRLAEAVRHQQRAIGLVEATASPPGETPRERARAAGEFVDWYRDGALWLAHLGRAEEAFEVAERARGRGLLAQLAERRLSFERDLPAVVEERRQQLASDYEIAWQELIGVEADQPEEHSRALARLNELLDERHSLEREIRQLSPRLARLRDPSSISFAEAAAALPRNTLLLAWVVGKEETLLLALRGEGGGRSSFETRLLPLGREPLARRVEGFRAVLGNASTAGLEVAGAVASELWEDLLGPVEGLLEGAGRLLLVPDRSLLRLPFAALLDDNGRYLIERMPVLRALSVTLALGDRPGERAGEGGLVAFGDPEPKVDPLPWSRLEAESIGRQRGELARVLLGSEASESAFKALAGDVRVVHFAGHAEIDDLFPMDSYLRLAPDGLDNGKLQAWEIFESLRIDASLVTLSACSTSLGREVDGEGMVGLAQALFFAGARAVVSSQWDVEDRATAYLMIRFYHHLGRGAALEEALREAQLDLLRDRVEWPDPAADGWLARALGWLGLGAEHSPAVAASLSHPNRWAAFELTISAR